MVAYQNLEYSGIVGMPPNSAPPQPYQSNEGSGGCAYVSLKLLTAVFSLFFFFSPCQDSLIANLFLSNSICGGCSLSLPWDALFLYNIFVFQFFKHLLIKILNLKNFLIQNFKKFFFFRYSSSIMESHLRVYVSLDAT